MSKIESLIDDDIKENIDNSAICVKFAMMTKQLEEKDKEIERLNNIINELEKWIKENNLSKYRTENVIDTDKLLDKLQELKGEDKE